MTYGCFWYFVSLKSARTYVRVNDLAYEAFVIIFVWQSDTILVDTPGIGGSKEVTQRLMEYLPNAVSFIFVIDVSKAGGMQIEKVSKNL